MEVGVPAETVEGEHRVALVPEVVRKLAELGSKFGPRTRQTP